MIEQINKFCKESEDIILFKAEGYELDQRSENNLRNYALSNNCIAIPIKTIIEANLEPRDTQRIPIETLGPEFKIIYQRSLKHLGHAWLYPYVFCMPKSVYEIIGPFNEELSLLGSAYDYTIRSYLKNVPVQVVDESYSPGPLKIVTELSDSDKKHFIKNYFYKFHGEKRTKKAVSWKELSASLPSGLEIISELYNFNKAVKNKSVALVSTPDQWIEEVYDNEFIVSVGAALDTVDADAAIVLTYNELKKAISLNIKKIYSPGWLIDQLTGAWLDPTTIYDRMVSVPTFTEFEHIYNISNAFWFDGAAATLAYSMLCKSQCREINIYSDSLESLCVDSRVLTYRLSEVSKHFKKQVRLSCMI